ncbi:hypothetical protein PFISCL1PPCAC_22360 [Pristionchus fissidentatus]|uniref:Uncharacterized protein n=1 Tax=Pristionchus fissidentatus TaxID=1538716 RepID=A0AAV5WLA2_9BILA|nr:hypothetical protein PFISCL1PPCAC_22360 [Pristionchus fissidentatus]
MRSAASSSSSMKSMTPSEGGGGQQMRTSGSRLAGGGERRTKGAGLQESILKAILVDPLPMVSTPVKMPLSHLPPRPPSIILSEQKEQEEEGKENGGGVRIGAKKARSVSSSAEDNEVFEILSTTTTNTKDPDQVDVTMTLQTTAPLTPATPIPSEMTLLAERSMSIMKNSSSFLDLTCASSTFNRSQRPKSMAIEELPDEWKEWLRACTDGDLVKAAEVLKKDPLMINWSPPLTPRLAGLHLAVRCGHLKMATWLCAQGADLNQQTLSGFTPLHIAAQQRNRGMVNELRRLGADVTKKDLFGRRFDHYTSWKEERRGGAVGVSSKESMRSCPATEYSQASPPRIVRSHPPSIYSRDSAGSFGRSSSIRDAVRGFLRNTFKKSSSIEKLSL